MKIYVEISDKEREKIKWVVKVPYGTKEYKEEDIRKMFLWKAKEEKEKFATQDKILQEVERYLAVRSCSSRYFTYNSGTQIFYETLDDIKIIGNNVYFARSYNNYNLDMIKFMSSEEAKIKKEEQDKERKEKEQREIEKYEIEQLKRLQAKHPSLAGVIDNTSNDPF